MRLRVDIRGLFCAGWCVWLFTVLAGVVLLVVNTKLVWIARYVTRGGIVHRLQPGETLSTVCTSDGCVPDHSAAFFYLALHARLDPLSWTRRHLHCL